MAAKEPILCHPHDQAQQARGQTLPDSALAELPRAQGCWVYANKGVSSCLGQQSSPW